MNKKAAFFAAHESQKETKVPAPSHLTRMNASKKSRKHGICKVVSTL